MIARLVRPIVLVAVIAILGLGVGGAWMLVTRTLETVGAAVVVGLLLVFLLLISGLGIRFARRTATAYW